ncbi:universal stress protein [Streptoalloteichus hindustanus]|uniref:Nucleotide-binding universal stress protein, UspA family n=1 Tax=Streptoalloteichus hindustanus TaxID=2017 RepID=A0A1M5DTL5_STRHI|nr:universal stress protein [Streptoalloteichus hindustanus]SHF70299.1 Nucleotide-binding universal stress protein, UspA family [Streptoalloteichus hindustanus]
MTARSHGAVVVGFDGSESARRAARWAAAEAGSRGRPLLVAHAFRWPLAELAWLRLPVSAVSEEPLRRAMAAELDDVAEQCRLAVPGLRVRTEVVSGEPVAALDAVAGDAELLVLGASEVNSAVTMLVGSTATDLARRVVTPMVLVRGEPRERPVAAGRVVVGVDGSPTSVEAVGFAVEFCARHRAGLVAVHAWPTLPFDALDPARAWGVDWAALREEAQDTLSRSLAGWSDRHPDVEVRRVVGEQRPAEALLREAQDADLVVVGSHGRGAVRRVLLGSVSHTLLRYAPCPVAVVRPHARSEP